MKIANDFLFVILIKGKFSIATLEALQPIKIEFFKLKQFEMCISYMSNKPFINLLLSLVGIKFVSH